LASGALPPGLRLEENGALRGVPAQANGETYMFTVAVTDSARVPQRVVLPCLLAVQAAKLRIVTKAAPLRIVTARELTGDVNNHTEPAADTLMADMSASPLTAVRGVAGSPAALAQQPKQLMLAIKPLLVGTNKVEGRASETEPVLITINFKNTSITSIEKKRPVEAEGKFILTLPGPLAVGDMVIVTQEVNGLQLRSQAVVLAADVVVEKKAPAAPHFEQPLSGTLSINGSAPKNSIVAVLVDDKPVRVLNEKGNKVDDKDQPFFERKIVEEGKFTITLFAPLEGKKIALQVKDEDSGKVTLTQAIDINPIGDIFDWGRVRAYFSAGVIFSKEREAFSQQDLMLAFNLDKTWWQMARPHSWFPFKNFNTFFETRLTSIPVVMPTPTPSAGMAGATPTLQSTAGGQQCNNIENGLSCFLASRKVAQMQVGGYLPIYYNAMKWRYDKHDNVVFAAPIAKFGIQTITSEEVTQLRDNNNGVNDVLNGDGVYNFFAFGTRLGHYKLLGNDSAPELISYIDITAGKWENFEFIRGQRCDDPLNKGTFQCENGLVVIGGKTLLVRERQRRLGFEGRLKIPSTPLFVGFDANLGKGPDDVRFLFGTRFDVGTLFGRLKFLQNLEK
jgi:hypothetical protein